MAKDRAVGATAELAVVEAAMVKKPASFSGEKIDMPRSRSPRRGFFVAMQIARRHGAAPTLHRMVDRGAPLALDHVAFVITSRLPSFNT